MSNSSQTTASKAAQPHRLIKSKNGSVKRNELRGKILVYFCAILIIVATLAITLFLTLKGLQSFVLNDVNVIKFITGMVWSPSGEGDFTYGAFPFIFGSFAITFLAALFAAPLGIGSAIFMTEIAKKWGQKVLQPVIEILVGIPSVVYGLIGLTVIVPIIRNHSSGVGFSLLAGMIVVGVMILPTVTSISADALKSIPSDIKDASYGLGATRWQTIYKVILPAALPSLATAVVLGMARAFGEALAVQMVIGNSKAMPEGITDQAATLTSIITLSMGHTTYGSVHNNLLWSLGLILLVMSYVFIIIIRLISSRRKV
ncbi:phosphate ABC transporter permease subunit PstC [Halobacillus salinarum]|uniref:Phosphate transport system permease protein n=1 Tax=Halobacillus salinarum TaxID=2932257 RepID=A0ABY4EEN0_9BACI|nr:phosphate ABC transporter permease subunit PstC [Halobacillus salinarum]UOQ42508.1 phosphate ABC transporter permease subunit PstC [Halobacillus salinarum]